MLFFIQKTEDQDFTRGSNEIAAYANASAASELKSINWVAISQEIPILNKTQDKSLDIIIKIKYCIDILKEIKTIYTND